ncbi:uncharacterized protein AB675_5576 [Cyphellophora attinorum]|uniref:Uncharacterized protein n=1 Tax=Cyphellophora attinorum TaxID=1664694 RepID=A0A0N0NNS3_9EURO|nr:uncharacterized protein AB675_5576 [Phialophora attinorum]KPI41921.1 hypothetical protein AB675_5576 [Phialophora attinorum]
MSTYSASSASDGIMTPTSSKSSDSIIDNNNQAQSDVREVSSPTTMLGQAKQGVKDLLAPFRADFNSEIHSTINHTLLVSLPITLAVMLKADTFHNKKVENQNFVNKNRCPANTTETRERLDLLAKCVNAGNHGPSFGSFYDQNSTKVHLLGGLLAVLAVMALIKTTKSAIRLTDTLFAATDKRMVREDGVMMKVGSVISALIMVLLNFIALFYVVTVIVNFGEWFGYATQYSGMDLSKLTWSLK